MADASVVEPADCPEPFWHTTHYYCPCCSWQAPDAPKSPADAEIDALRAKLAAAEMNRDEWCDDAVTIRDRWRETQNRLAAAEALLLRIRAHFPVDEAAGTIRNYEDDEDRDDAIAMRREIDGLLTASPPTETPDDP